MYDLCVVGAGCIGSAAARHASKWGNVCLVGPKEPPKRTIASSRDTFGAHYDEGRITRSTDEDVVWSTLARESIARYRDIEKCSGIQFYNEVGYIICGTKDSRFVRTNKERAQAFGINTSELSEEKLQAKFPFLNFGHKDVAIYESANSGYVSPRRIIQAEIKLAKENGCHVIDDVVKTVDRFVEGGKYKMKVTTLSGQQIIADKILLATGAFTSFKNILPTNVEIAIALCPINIARIEINSDDYLKIRNMPSVSYVGEGAQDWKSNLKRDSKNNIRFYMLPPVKYPDGRYYIKLGHFWEDYPKKLKTAEEVKTWFCSGGNDEVIAEIVRLIQDIVKDVKMLSHVSDCCVIVKTPSGRPYIDKIHSQLGLAIGGNGQAAKSCDEIGRIAAGLMMKDTWNSSLKKDWFHVIYKSDSKL